jgi:hypothetical protein
MGIPGLPGGRVANTTRVFGADQARHFAEENSTGVYDAATRQGKI